MAKKKVKLKLIFKDKIYFALVAIVILLIALSFYGYPTSEQKYTFTSTTTTNRLNRALLPTSILDTHHPNKLVVTRQDDPVDHFSALNLTVSNPELVKKIYEDIYLLPTLFPEEKCPAGGHRVYTLVFYQNNTVTDTAVFSNIGGCRLVSLDKSTSLVAQYPFISDFEKATGLSEQTIW